MLTSPKEIVCIDFDELLFLNTFSYPCFSEDSHINHDLGYPARHLCQCSGGLPLPLGINTKRKLEMYDELNFLNNINTPGGSLPLHSFKKESCKNLIDSKFTRKLEMFDELKNHKHVE